MSQKTDTEGIVASIDSLIQLRLDARTLNLDLSRGARSILAGQHRSRFRGRGMDYAESRQYQPGDDVRSIDWRLTARSGKTHTKIFIEERERPVFLLMDFSPSTYFGTRSTYKTVQAARAGALLAWTAIHNGDRLGGVIMANGQLTDLKPKAGRGGALAMINALSAATRLQTVHTSDYSQLEGLNRALSHLNAVVHPASLVFLFSDFYSLDETSIRLITKIRQHNDMVAFQLIDPIEITPPKAGRYPISDNKSSGRVSILNTSGKRNREKYLRIFNQRKIRLEQQMNSLKIPVVDLVNGHDASTELQSAFGKPGSHSDGGQGVNVPRR